MPPLGARECADLPALGAGWSQVSLRHLFTMVGNANLTGRQRFGLLYLLGWREFYPWISCSVPGPRLLVPARLATGRLVRADLRLHDDLHNERGIMQTWTAWRLARPELR
jgi:hypothetical protein